MLAWSVAVSRVGLVGRLRERVCSCPGRGPATGGSRWVPVVVVLVECTILRERRGLEDLLGNSGLEGPTEVEEVTSVDTDTFLRMLGGT